MIQKPFKVAVIGAGAIGGWIAARLHLAIETQSEHAASEVCVITRGETHRTIQTSGLRLVQKGEQQTHWIPGPTANFLKESGQTFDLIIVSVKAQTMAQAAVDIAPLMHADTAVLTAMNGVPWWFLQGFGGECQGKTLQSVDPGGAITTLIAPQHILGCVVHASCSTTSPGLVQHHFGNGLIIGEPSGAVTPRLERVLALFKGAGFDATASGSIQRDIWYKLWGNMTMNPISALTGSTTDRVLGDDLVRGFVSAVMLEAKEIGARIGLPIDQAPEDRHAVTAKLGAFKTSMLQDTEAGRAIELDAIVGAVHELGHFTGVATPHTSALLGLTRLMAQQRGLYPT